MTAYGRNIVRNGTFQNALNWSLGDGWSISSDTAVFLDSGTVGNLYQTTEADVGNTYLVTFTVSGFSMSGGNPYVYLGGDLSFITADGNYSVELTPTLSNGYLLFVPNANNAGNTFTLSNATVSQKAVSGEVVVSYSVDDGDWEALGIADCSTNYDSFTFFINRAGKRMKFKFSGNSGNFEIREYKIHEPEVFDDR